MKRGMAIAAALALAPLGAGADDATQAQAIWASACSRCHRDVSTVVQRLATKDAAARAAYLDTFLPRHHLPDQAQRAELVTWLLAQISE